MKNDSDHTTSNPPDCIHCGKPVVGRGLCNACYSSASRQVRRGTVSWEQLTQQGKALPRQDPRRPRNGSRKNLVLGGVK